LWDRDAALDVVQDSMVRLVEKYAAKPPEEWSPLFFRILRNRIEDVRRYRRVRSGIVRIRDWWSGGGPHDDRQPTEPVAPPAERPDARLASRETGERVRQALKELPARQRQVVILRESHELSVQETAQLLGISEGAVKQHHFRAIRRLRERLPEGC
jgi:RNA polymerase sigma-70 factor (ECF subfamily)